MLTKHISEIDKKIISIYLSLKDSGKMSEPTPMVPSVPIQAPTQQSIEISQIAAGGPIGVKKQSTLIYPPDKGDVAIGKENLQKIYNVCKTAEKKNHHDDWLLTIASIFAGAFITGLISSATRSI